MATNNYSVPYCIMVFLLKELGEVTRPNGQLILYPAIKNGDENWGFKINRKHPQITISWNIMPCTLFLIGWLSLPPFRRHPLPSQLGPLSYTEETSRSSETLELTYQIVRHPIFLTWKCKKRYSRNIDRYSLKLYAPCIILQYVYKPTRCTKFLWLDFIFY